MRSKASYEKKLEQKGSILDCEIICPHCFIENEDDFDLTRDGDQERDISCKECGEKMDIKVEVSKIYITRKAKIGSW